LSTIAKLDNILEKFAKAEFKDKVVCHNNRDSTAIHAREKVIHKKNKIGEKQPKKRGKLSKTEAKQEKQPGEMQKQLTACPEESLDALNKQCSFGCKKNSQGNMSFWKGYKLHLDISDCGFPITACVTGAHVHDSMLAIPMEKMTEQRVTFCYSLMDSAYDAKKIKDFIVSRERVPIIDPNKRKSKNCLPLDPAKQERYKIRSTGDVRLCFNILLLTLHFYMLPFFHLHLRKQNRFALLPILKIYQKGLYDILAIYNLLSNLYSQCFYINNNYDLILQKNHLALSLLNPAFLSYILLIFPINLLGYNKYHYLHQAVFAKHSSIIVQDQ
jgi:hypothetical protein